MIINYYKSILNANRKLYTRIKFSIELSDSREFTYNIQKKQRISLFEQLILFKNYISLYIKQIFFKLINPQKQHEVPSMNHQLRVCQNEKYIGQQNYNQNLLQYLKLKSDVQTMQYQNKLIQQQLNSLSDIVYYDNVQEQSLQNNKLIQKQKQIQVLRQMLIQQVLQAQSQQQKFVRKKQLLTYQIELKLKQLKQEQQQINNQNFTVQDLNNLQEIINQTQIEYQKQISYQKQYRSILNDKQIQLDLINTNIYRIEDNIQQLQCLTQQIQSEQLDLLPYLQQQRKLFIETSSIINIMQNTQQQYFDLQAQQQQLRKQLIDKTDDLLIQKGKIIIKRNHILNNNADTKTIQIQIQQFERTIQQLQKLIANIQIRKNNPSKYIHEQQDERSSYISQLSNDNNLLIETLKQQQQKLRRLKKLHKKYVQKQKLNNFQYELNKNKQIKQKLKYLTQINVRQKQQNLQMKQKIKIIYQNRNQLIGKKQQQVKEIRIINQNMMIQIEKLRQQHKAKQQILNQYQMLINQNINKDQSLFNKQQKNKKKKR